MLEFNTSHRFGEALSIIIGELVQERLLGVIDALGIGYRIVARRPYVIAIPVLVDLIIWLLPSISILEVITARLGPEYSATQQDGLATFSQISWLLGFFLPPTGLLADNLGAAGPTIELTSFGSMLGAIVLLLGAGAIIASAYLVLLANAIEGRKTSFDLMPLLADKSLKFLGLTMGVGAAMTAVSGGFALLAVGFAAAASSLPGVIVILVSLLLLIASVGLAVGMFVASLVMYFAILALMLEPVSVRDSIRRSIFFWRGNLGPAIVFVLLVTFLQLVLAFVWSGLSQATPGLIVSVFGSAFIGTGLSAGSMVFYANRLSQPEVIATDRLGA